MDFCISVSSLSILSYSVSLFDPYHCKISSESSSTAVMIRSILSSVSVAFILGLLAHVFFLAKVFSGEAFLFCEVSVPIGGSLGGVASPSSYVSLSSPPPFPLPWSSPPPSGEPDPSSTEVLSSSSISWTSTFFFFFFTLLCLTCSTQVTKGLPMMSALKSYAYSTGTRKYFVHSLVISSISSLVSL
jgi:hypothetical protein